jgi:hypothetical protein
VTAVPDTLTSLKARHPGWPIWVVPLCAGGETWCARKIGAPLEETLTADTAAHLAEYIAEAGP